MAKGRAAVKRSRISLSFFFALSSASESVGPTPANQSYDSEEKADISQNDGIHGLLFAPKKREKQYLLYITV